MFSAQSVEERNSFKNDVRYFRKVSHLDTDVLRNIFLVVDAKRRLFSLPGFTRGERVIFSTVLPIPTSHSIHRVLHPPLAKYPVCVYHVRDFVSVNRQLCRL